MRNSSTFKYVFIASMTGFLMGFDTVVISGVNLLIREMWNTSDWIHGTLIVSMTLWGIVLGALLGGYPTERLGRKSTLILVGFLCTAAVIGASLATNLYIFSFFRFVGGFGIGMASIASPTYISEISEAHNRGRMNMLFQLNIVLGILMAYLSNYLLQGILEENSWRIMIGIELLPATIYTALIFSIPKSPRWLMLKKNTVDTPKTNTNNLNEPIKESFTKNIKNKSGLFSGKYNRILLLAFLMAFFNQLSGISFILFYVPELLGKTGLGTSESLLSSVSVGLINLIFTFVGISLIDKLGRKQLMYIGSIGYIISLSMVALSFIIDASPLFTLIFLLLFIASHAVGQGAVIFVFIPEIFPTEVRSFGQAWGSGLLNVFAAITALLGAVLINALTPQLIFGIFAFFMVLQLLFTHFMMPETKGVTLEDIEQKLINH
ncbi:sugar porter family MFS transporter [uncultured Draconibacterium sp.]|uniref:sugar porter family MFS transporter n=1 Tax=uncultured Draconibacterium sp. TaxID=1573823 RepID=UPI0029C7CA32|nr:sugar porter family MFS transporter [uncultured Draconibacterium sp.]